MEMRELKALEIAARARVVFDGAAWSVPSQSGSGSYSVTLNPVSCTCDDFQLRQKPCKHVLAVRIIREREGGPKNTQIVTDEIPKRPTYKQNWPLYNLAQQTEKNWVTVHGRRFALGSF